MAYTAFYFSVALESLLGKYLDNIVRGQTHNPKAKTLHKIALAFNMTLAEFLDFPELNNYSFDEDEE